MKVRWFIFVLILGLIGLFWWYRLAVLPNKSPASVRSDVFDDAVTSGSLGLPTHLIGESAGFANHEPQTAAPVTNALHPALQALLARPRPWSYAQWPKPSDIPQLDAAMQAEVVRRFQAAGSPTNKWILSHVLAFGGNAQVIGVFAKALTNDYAGKHLTTGENAALATLLQFIGVIAHRYPEAVGALQQMRQQDYWRGVRLWDTPADRTESYTVRSLVGSAIKGLAWSGQPEADRMLEHFRDNPAMASSQSIDGAVIDAACIHYLVAKHGFEPAWNVIRPPAAADPSGMRVFVKWVQETPEGQQWWRWKSRANRSR